MTMHSRHSDEMEDRNTDSEESIKKSIFGGDTFTRNVEKADKLKAIAEKLGCSLAQMSLAWCIANKHVVTVLIGASKSSQLGENLKALAFVDKITPEVKAEIDAIAKYVPSQPWVDHLQDIRMRHL
ncbi:Voltage-gated potassium channel subunit beta-2 [Phytophthora ramorum]|nr:putative voltage-gated potassium channel subunit beta [Phytophthora ramorum]